MEQGICVAQVISNLEIGGAQKLLCVMAETQAHADITTKVAVLRAPSDTQYHAELIAAGAEVAYFPGSGFGSLRQIKQLAAWFRREGIELAHSHMQRGNIVSTLAAKIAGVPAICGLHVPYIETHGAGSWRRTAETSVIKHAATGLIACSQTVADSHASLLAPRSIGVVTNPVPYAIALTAEQIGEVQQEKTKFLVVGRLAPEKAVDRVLIAAKALLTHRTDFTITLAGDGACRAALEQQCTTLGLEDHVVFLGTVAEVAPLYLSHDVYLSTSRAEGLSMALLEAMAHGLPVIATPAGDSAKLVTSQTGYGPAQNDVEGIVQAMVNMIDAPEARATMGQKARKLVMESYSPQAWVAEMGRRYRATIERSR